jgi:hypothetical protein
VCVSIKQTGWLSRDYTVYTNPEQVLDGSNCFTDFSWFFLNKSGKRGGEVCVELENFVRGWDRDNVKRGQPLWRVDFVDKPAFWQNVRQPGSAVVMPPIALFGKVALQWGGHGALHHDQRYLAMLRTRRTHHHCEHLATAICNFHMNAGATLSSYGAAMGCGGLPIPPRKCFGRDVCLNVQALGTAACRWYKVTRESTDEDGRVSYHTSIERDTMEHVDVTEFALLDRADPTLRTVVTIPATGVPVAFGMTGDVTDDTANYDCPLFTVRQNGGFWSNDPPCVTTKPGVDPALAILLSHLMLKEYSTKEIKKDFKPQFPFQPPWGMTPMM